MARTPGSKKKNVYELIESTQQEIERCETRLVGLKKQLKEYEAQRDKEEMEALFRAVKEQGLSVEEAMSKLTQN